MKENLLYKPIDFVITWVDGADPVWLNEKKKYDKTVDVDDSIERYRDYGTLKYLLRSIDKYASWVRFVFLVTSGQVPKWLNTVHPKLKIVSHEDFIPKKYLPTFSSHPIEWNLHRIKGLSENFVSFNDDFILTAPVKPDDFFKNDLPCDTFGLGLLGAQGFSTYIAFNNMGVLNKHFNFKKTLRENRRKFFKLKNGIELPKALIMSTQNMFYGMHDHHTAISFKKSFFDILWKTEYDLIDETCSNRIRSKTDVSYWLVRYWQILTGNFYPRANNFGRFFSLDLFVSDKHIKRILKNQKYKVICVNDSGKQIDDEEKFKQIMDMVLGEKSSYEK